MLKQKVICSSLLILFAVLIVGATPPSWKSKVNAKVLENAEAGQVQEFIVIFGKKADISDARFFDKKEEKGAYVLQRLTHEAEITQSDAKAFLESRKIAYQPLYIVNAIVVVSGYEVLKELAEMDEVESIIPNRTIYMEKPIDPHEVLSRDSSFIQWGILKIEADKVWDKGFHGEGVTIGGADTGYEWDHPALKEMYRGYVSEDSVNHNYNWHDAIHFISPIHNDSVVSPTNNPCGLNLTAPCDDNNHGTHTMGTMVGEGDINKIGIAPGASWIGCRNMERGWGSLTTYLECFQWFLAPTNINNENPDPSLAPHVINNSWHCPEIEGCNPANFHLMEEAVNNLKAAGIVVVVSAGNAGSLGCSSISTPAAIFENSFTVGATNEVDTLAGFSSRGPVTVDSSGRLKPNVVAPGVNILSSVRGGGYASFGGTSMAGPHVAGTVALMISANPDLAGQVELIETILEETAVPLTEEDSCGMVSNMEVPNNLYGYGRIDALAAVNAALDLITSTEEAGESFQNSFRIFPNPFSDEFTISLVQPGKELRVEILDLNGKLIGQRSIISEAKTRITTLKDVPSGLYICKIITGKTSYSKLIVKQ